MSALQDQWINQAQQLRADSLRLENVALKLSASNATSGQIAQAEIKHLNAVKQYNDFLDTAKQDYAKAMQYEARLRNEPNLSALERHQLEITRDALNARAGEFQQFANDNTLFPQSGNPGEAGSRTRRRTSHE